MLEASHYSAAGARRKAIALPPDPFDGTVNEAALHRSVVVFLANQRQGTHATKTRSAVSGGGRKPWRQKGTGRARQGSIRAAHWRGGGVVFGPSPRNYRMGLPRKVRRLARKSAFNARAREGAIHVIERFAFETPKTRAMADLLEKLGVKGESVLILTARNNPNVFLSARNLPGVRVRPYAEAAPYEILQARQLVIEEEALGTAPVADEASAPVATKPRARRPRAGGAREATKAKSTTKSRSTKPTRPKQTKKKGKES